MMIHNQTPTIRHPQSDNHTAAPEHPVQVVGDESARIIAIDAAYHDDRSNRRLIHGFMKRAQGPAMTMQWWRHRTLAVCKEIRQPLAVPSCLILVSFDEPGNYYLWIRGWGDMDVSGEGSRDSVHAGINGRVSDTAVKIDKFPAGWRWSRHTRDNAPAVIKVPSRGIHAINLWMREDGFAIDKFLLTQVESYTPSGVGPACRCHDGDSRA